MPQRRDVVAAGVVVLRPGREVLLVHRPRYDDWSLPKGKLDHGEIAPVAAVREVGEETGLHVRLGAPLADQHYPVVGGDKTVHYWVGWVVGDDEVGSYPANDEIDQVRWVPYEEALARLSYARDRASLVEAWPLRRTTHPLLVVRHGDAQARASWRGRPDRERPLAPRGHEQARRLVALLEAYDVSRLVTSSSTRCVQTIAPYAARSGWGLEELDALSEEEATTESVLAVVDDLVVGSEGAALCTHRPVLPTVLDALDLPDPRLDPGAVLVVHRRAGRVVATEVHPRP